MKALKDLLPSSAPVLGLGTWALGGPFWAGTQPLGWGNDFDPARGVEVLRTAFDAGITLYDTSDAYGTGAAERLIGEALSAKRDEVVLVTKWGNVIDEQNRQLVGEDASPGYVRTALEASLRRLRTDHLDVYLLHLSGLPVPQARELLGTLEELVDSGLIRAYGWSTDAHEAAASWVGQRGFGAVEFEINVLRDASAMVALCEDNDLVGLARGPLATGLLGGRYTSGTQILDAADFRRQSPEWLAYFRDGRPDPAFLAALQAIRDILTSDGRTLAQGALAWLWARSPALIPIPGARTVEQARSNAEALRHGPLSDQQMTEIAGLLERAVRER